MANVTRIVRRFEATAHRHYKYDEADVHQKLHALNNDKARQESDAELGGHNVTEFLLVPIDDIDLPPTWHPGRTKALQEAFDQGKPLPPVQLARPDSGGPWVIEDGIHRTNESKRRGYTHVPAFVTHWVEATEKLVPPEPEKPKLAVGTWVKLRKPEAGRLHGWVDEQISTRNDKGVRRWVYSIALVKPGDTYPDFIDARDTECDPAKPPSWGPALKRAIEIP